MGMDTRTKMVMHTQWTPWKHVTREHLKDRLQVELKFSDGILGTREQHQDNG